jgi:prevent-host-death family protein
MISVTIAEAKSRLVELIDQVATGEEVVIMRRGHAVARLVAGTPKAKLSVHSVGRIATQATNSVLEGLEDSGDTQPMKNG